MPVANWSALEGIDSLTTAKGTATLFYQGERGVMACIDYGKGNVDVRFPDFDMARLYVFRVLDADYLNRDEISKLTLRSAYTDSDKAALAFPSPEQTTEVAANFREYGNIHGLKMESDLMACHLEEIKAI